MTESLSWRPRGIPLWLKWAYTAWMLVWVPAYWVQYGPVNFLWLCDAANLIIALGLWLESPLLLSAQAVSVLLIQLVWMIDFFGRLLAGVHLIGGTEYMFDPAKPLPVRLLSLFHVFVPVLLVWALWRLGYERRGWRLQTLIAWILLPVTFLVADPELNVNWLWKPFNVEQTLMPPVVYLLVCLVAYPLLIYLPTHLVLARLTPASTK